MKVNLKSLITAVLIPLLVGGASALLTMNQMETFSGVAKPQLSPPGWLFPVVWSILYITMGLASYFAENSGGNQKDIDKAMRLYGLQLFFNFAWSIIFFNFGAYTFAFVWLLILLFLIILTTIEFFKLSKPAGYLMIPYILWVIFAGYLNLGIALMN